MQTNHIPLSLSRIGRIAALLLLALTAVMPPEVARANGSLCYVDDSAGGGADTGLSWTDAFLDLQDALADAGCLQIWVAEGTYKPDGASAGDRSLSFRLKSGVAIYGGFDGSESVIDDRDPKTDISTLSGEIGAAGTSDNSYHVVNGSGADATAVLDGFTITDGRANGGGLAETYGAGIYISGGAPTLNQLLIQFNVAGNGGGGIYVVSSSPAPAVTNTEFYVNSAGLYGGAAYVTASAPSFKYVLFNDNESSAYGGAVTIASAGGTFTNVTFSANTADVHGGAIYDIAGDPVLNHVTFSGNAASGTADAIYSESFSDPQVHNSIVWEAGSEFFTSGDSTLTLVDSIVEGGCPGGASCTNVTLTDPALGALQYNGGYTPTMALPTLSSAIDAGGSNAACASDDQRGLGRPQGPRCDIGAYESGVCLVDDTASGANSGKTWGDAYTDLQSALTDDWCNQVWVAEGVYKPTTGSDRNISFVIPPGVALYGGLDGSETEVTDRDPAANLTVLSGDIDNNDADTDLNSVAEVYTEISGINSFNVVLIDGTATDVTTTTVLDGVTVTAGKGDGGAYSEGGGLFCDATDGMCSPMIYLVTFSGNFADYGGAIFNEADSNAVASPVIMNTTFVGNGTSGNGGAIFNYAGISGESSPILEGVTFEGNYADGNGGAIMNAGGGGVSSPEMTNVTFKGNTAGNLGGAIFNFGYTAASGEANPLLTNVTFSGNSAYQGGAIANQQGDGATGGSVLRNVILWGDTASSSGNEVINLGGATSNIHYGVVQGGCGSIGGGLCSAAGMLSTDPMLGPLADHGGPTRTMALLGGSSAINSGDDALCPAVDQNTMARPIGPHCDLGAYEAPVMRAARADFNANGITDLSVFRPSNGTWYIKNLFNSIWGTTGDVPVPADYDGDGDNEVAAWRPSNGTWYIKNEFNAVWGNAGDVPVPGDYNGDGTADVAVWRPSTGLWYVKGQFTSAWGTSGDIPVPGDYNGDGRTDMAVFRPSTGTFYVKNLFNSAWGTSTDIPVPADYDGDGDTDVAVWRPSTGIWYVKNQFNSGWGNSTDIPVPGLYNAGPTADVAVWRPSTGTWYVKALFNTGWGTTGDFVLPARDTNGDGDPYQ